MLRGETTCASTKIFLSDKKASWCKSPAELANNMAQDYPTSDKPVVPKHAREAAIVLAEYHEIMTNECRCKN